MMDGSGVIILIQALVNAKTANKWVINSHSHSDFAPKYLVNHTPLNHTFIMNLTTTMLT